MMWIMGIRRSGVRIKWFAVERTIHEQLGASGGWCVQAVASSVHRSHACREQIPKSEDR